MSAETKKAVLDSFRFSVEHWPSEIIYSALILYVLYTRTLLDIQENALPFFGALVVCYQIAGLIARIWMRKIPDQWDLIYWIGLITIFSASYVLVMYGVIALVVDILTQLSLFWESLDPFANQTQFMVVTGFAVCGVGGVLFWFRLKQRFLYGITEIGVGVSFGMHRVTIEQWSGAPTCAGFYLALLTAGIYLVVRGADNIHQAYKDNDPTLHRFSLFFLRKSLRPSEQRRRVSRVRAIQVRKGHR